MELHYPINLVGFEGETATGDVLTCDGEFVGLWEFVADEQIGTGEFRFIRDGDKMPMFSEGVGVIGSGMQIGLAMSRICGDIKDWHEQKR